MKSISAWLASGFIALVVSCIAFASISIVYEWFDLQKRLGIDDDICWLALLLGPAPIVIIHRGFHRHAWVSVVTLLAGLALAGLGVIYFMYSREAGAHHEPTGPLSGIGFAIGMLMGLIMVLVGGIAVLGAILAIVARRIGRSAEANCRD